MNILFLTMVKIRNTNSGSILLDLFHELEKKDIAVYIISPVEKKEKNTPRNRVISEGNIHILNVGIGDYFNTSFIRKGMTLIGINRIYKKAISLFFSDIKFDAVVYSTPPIMFTDTIEYIKKRDNAKSYLMLKDIFPQNALDLGILSTRGLKGILYKYFRKQEIDLYNVSDTIGCMSPANVDYVLKENKYLSKEKVELFPNCISVLDWKMSSEDKRINRRKHGLPEDSILFIYGGNLGKPQGISFLLDCLYSVKEDSSIYFLIIGDGAEYERIESFISSNDLRNVKLEKRLEKRKYEEILVSCDIGMIFLDHRFTIPNFPSRLLGYLKYKIPVIAATDPNTDIGKIAVENDFGWWIESNNVDDFKEIVSIIKKSNLIEKGNNGYEFLNKNYNAEKWAVYLMNKLSRQG